MFKVHGASARPLATRPAGPPPPAPRATPVVWPPRTAEARRPSAPATDTPASLTQRLVSKVGRLPASVAAAAMGATVTAATIGVPVEAQAQTAFESPLSESILNPRGVGNVGDRPDLFDGTRIERAPDRTVQIDRDAQIADPSTVMTRSDHASGAAEIRRIVQQGIDAPRTAQAVAEKLAELYGPYSASNSEANRRAIIDNLRWIAGIGVHYDNARADSIDPTTQSPNATLSTRSGVCRDTHTAAAAVLASLMNAHQVDGRWVPGSPTGQEANVQVANFATPHEHHAFLVYRDPARGGWDALEYGRSYALGAQSAAAAVRSLPNHLPGYSTYRITGWDSKPVISDRRVVDAAAARGFFADDPGVGTPGEVRLRGTANGAGVTAFITPNLAFAGELRESPFGDTLEGGVRLNYHQDLRDADSHGYVRIGGGVYTSAFEVSDTGRRAESDREQVRTYVFGLKYDRRHEINAREIFGEHLKWRYGYDIDMFVGVPLGPEGFVLGNIGDYSNVDVGLDGALLGRERLSPNLTLDWAVQARYEVDVMRTSLELVSSEGRSFGALGTDALRADFAMALTHEGDSGLITRFEAGGTQWLASPLDPEVAPQGSHYAVMTLAPKDGTFDFGVLARGRQIDGELVPIDSLGVALRLTPNEDFSLGVTVDSVFPDGDLRRIGDNVQITGGLNYRF